MGRKLSTARFALKSVRNSSSRAVPWSAYCRAILRIVHGPAISRIETLFVPIAPTVR